MPFKNLFKPSDKPDDGFTQPAREALVDILHYCMYADRHVALAEDHLIETVARTLNWDPRISYEYYETKSTGAARRALADKESLGDFMASLRERLQKPEQRKMALRLADDLMIIDGQKKPEETAALLELQRALEG